VKKDFFFFYRKNETVYISLLFGYRRLLIHAGTLREAVPPQGKISTVLLGTLVPSSVFII